MSGSQIVLSLGDTGSLFIRLYFGDTLLSSGTAFVAHSTRGPLLITNRHNATGRHQETGQPLSPSGGVPDRLKVFHHLSGRLGNWIEHSETLFRPDGSPRWIEHPVLGARADFVALPLTQLQRVDLNPYDPRKPGLDLELLPSEIVSVIGFPFGKGIAGALPIWATGFLASHPDLDYDGLPVFLIDCRTRPGQSGSAVVAFRPAGTTAFRNGQLVHLKGNGIRFLGIYSGRINADSDLGMVWRAAALAELIAHVEAVGV